MAKELKSAGLKGVSASFKVGAIAFVFLIIGYQASLFIHSAALTGIAAHRDAPDTVYVIDEAVAARLLAESGVSLSESLQGPSQGQAPASADHNLGNEANGRGDSAGATSRVIIRREAGHSARAEAAAAKVQPRRVESFTFDPNTVSIRDLQRLGFSEKQALSIDSYRRKGGRFRRASDFAKSYVVADSVYERLEPFIRIPKVDINAADSAAFDALPGIGPYFAVKMVEYRTKLRGYSYPEQLMDIYNFDREKYDGLKDLISVGPHEPYPIWSLGEEELKAHPYIGKYAAHGVVVYREHNPESLWTVEGLIKAGVIDADNGTKLSRCLIE